MATVENPRRWWELSAWRLKLRPLRKLSAWAVSFIAHLAALLILASLTLYSPIRERIMLSLAPP